MEVRNNRRRMLAGEVVSDKMNKTRVVCVHRVAKHSKYNKTIKTTAKFKAHDEKNAAKMGDIVRIMEVRPISKDKRWVIMEIIKSNQVSKEEIA